MAMLLLLASPSKTARHLYLFNKHVHRAMMRGYLAFKSGYLLHPCGSPLFSHGLKLFVCAAEIFTKILQSGVQTLLMEQRLVREKRCLFRLKRDLHLVVSPLQFIQRAIFGAFILRHSDHTLFISAENLSAPASAVTTQRNHHVFPTLSVIAGSRCGPHWRRSRARTTQHVPKGDAWCSSAVPFFAASCSV